MQNPVEIRITQMEPRYDETKLRHQQQAERKETVAILSVRRNALLIYLLVLVCQFASVDNFNILPVGILTYMVGVVGAMEAVTNWEKQEQEALRQQLLQWEREDFDKKYNAALFEYHVLKGKPNTKIVTVEEDGVSKLFAIH